MCGRQVDSVSRRFILGRGRMIAPSASRLGKKWHIFKMMFRISIDIDVSFMIGVPVARIDHFSWGILSMVRHPSMPSWI